jgi:putative transcriptional regulator
MQEQFKVDIRELRRNLRMTQEEFAHTLGITVATVNRWENGHARPSKLARRAIERLAQIRKSENPSPSF